jgi:1-acyl-sn-glycerol-3-phosphate acyltransferase
MRDGISNLQRNDEVFDRMVDILKKGKQICIFPEGNHDKYRRLRTLSKGMFRIAFKAETDMDFNAKIHIVPAGIDYSNYYKARAKLTIHFGDAIKLADYKEVYEENPQKAINKLRSDLAERMSELMIDIKTEEHYDTYMAIREIYGNYNKVKTKRRNHPLLGKNSNRK